MQVAQELLAQEMLALVVESQAVVLGFLGARPHHCWMEVAAIAVLEDEVLGEDCCQ